MKQIITILLVVFTSLVNKVEAATPLITMTTAKNVGESISFQMAANGNTFVQIDYGSGGPLDNRLINTTTLTINGTVGSSKTIKIYGSGITYFDCSNNQLTSLDVSNATTLTYLKNSNNILAFNTLPIPVASYTLGYIYAPQEAINLSAVTLINTPVDLSNQYSINGNLTNYIWKTESGAIVPTNYYTSSNGIFTFTQIPSEKVYCEMTNSIFPDFTGTNTLKTTLTSISTTAEINEDIKVAIKVYTKHQTVFVNLTDKAKITVYDLTGSKIDEFQTNNGQNNFDIPHKGIYIIKIETEKHTFKQKVVIN